MFHLAWNELNEDTDQPQYCTIFCKVVATFVDNLKNNNEESSVGSQDLREEPAPDNFDEESFESFNNKDTN
jgi:FMN-dependent NADH-azoreductase